MDAGFNPPEHGILIFHILQHLFRHLPDHYLATGSGQEDGAFHGGELLHHSRMKLLNSFDMFHHVNVLLAARRTALLILLHIRLEHLRNELLNGFVRSLGKRAARTIGQQSREKIGQAYLSFSVRRTGRSDHSRSRSCVVPGVVSQTRGLSFDCWKQGPLSLLHRHGYQIG